MLRRPAKQRPLVVRLLSRRDGMFGLGLDDDNRVKQVL
jgi:hypothetical protein